MMRAWPWTLLVVLVATGIASAQAPWRFRWQAGQELNYQVEQTRWAEDVIEGNRAETSTRLSLVKSWKVLEVDPAGIATLQMSLRSLRIENTAPNGEVIRFDSANLEQSHPQMKEQLARYVGVPLAVLRIDAVGKVVEVKQSIHGSPNRFENELPFGLVLPPTGPQPGLAWERSYQITLDPPQGTGEKYPAVQKFTCRQVANGQATVGVSTTIAKMPEAVADRLPLLQFVPQGELVFDLQAGRLLAITLHIDQEQKGHQGENSRYRFKSDYHERLLTAP